MTEAFTFIARDTDTDKLLLNHEMRAITYEPVWQRLRIGLSFRSFEDCRASIISVVAYVQSTPGGDAYERGCRLFRAMNLLNALPLGRVKQGMLKVIPKDREILIRQYRKEFRAQLEENGYPDCWDWAVVRRSCNNMASTEDGFNALSAIHRNLQQRVKRKPGGKPELRYFMSILEEALHD